MARPAHRRRLNQLRESHPCRSHRREHGRARRRRPDAPTTSPTAYVRASASGALGDHGTASRANGIAVLERSSARVPSPQGRRRVTFLSQPRPGMGYCAVRLPAMLTEVRRRDRHYSSDGGYRFRLRRLGRGHSVGCVRGTRAEGTSGARRDGCCLACATPAPSVDVPALHRKGVAARHVLFSGSPATLQAAAARRRAERGAAYRRGRGEGDTASQGGFAQVPG